MGNLISSFIVITIQKLLTLKHSLTTFQGFENDENNRRGTKRKNKRKNRKKQQNITTTVKEEAPTPAQAPTTAKEVAPTPAQAPTTAKEVAPTPAPYRYPTMIKTLGDFKLHVCGGEFTESQIIVIQGLKDTGKTTFIRMLAGVSSPDAVEFKMPKYNVSHKPQRIGFMMSASTVRDLVLNRIPDAYNDPQFQSLVFQPLLIQQLMDQDIVNLLDAQLQRLEICLCLRKPADIYLIDEPSAYLNSEERSAAAQVIKRYIRCTKKTAFVVESNHSMAISLRDKVIFFNGKPGSDCIASLPKNQFVNLIALAELMKDGGGEFGGGTVSVTIDECHPVD